MIILGETMNGVTLLRTSLGWTEEVSVFAGYILDDRCDEGGEREKTAFLLVDEDGFWGWPVKLAKCVWMQFETFWKRCCNGLSDMLLQAREGGGV